MIMTGTQIAAARALLKWTQQDLANATDLSTIAIKKVESGATQPRESTINIIREAFSRNGIEFIDGGVRERQDLAQILEGEQGIREFYNDVANLAESEGGEFLVYCIGQNDLVSSIQNKEIFSSYRERMLRAKGLKLLALRSFADEEQPNVDYVETKYLPEDNYYTSLFFFVYGTCIDVYFFCTKG